MGIQTYTLRISKRIEDPIQFLNDFLSLIDDPFKIEHTPSHLKNKVDENFFKVFLPYGELELSLSGGWRTFLQYPQYGVRIHSQINFQTYRHPPEQFDWEYTFDMWLLCVANYFDTTTEDATEGDELERLLRINGVLYDGMWWFGSNNFDGLIDLKTIPAIKDLPLWKPEYYIGQSHQIFLSTDIPTSEDVMVRLLELLGVTNPSKRTLHATQDMRITISADCKEEFAKLEALRSIPLSPSYVIEYTPQSTDGYLQLLRIINALIEQNIDFIFAWQYIPLLMQKDSKVKDIDYSNGRNTRLRLYYTDILKFDIDGH